MTAVRREEPVEPAPAGPLPEGARLFVLLGGLTAFGPLSIDMYLPALPIIARDLKASESMIQLTLTACLIGLAVGQVLAGPMSDSLGRRLPLLVGVAGYALASLLCALAPSALLLVGLRCLQGITGGAGIVIARAVVRDMYTGSAAARYFSRLVLIMGLAPILAPVIGGQALRFTSWHGIFVILSLIAVLLFAGAFLGLPETLPPTRRRAGGLGNTLATFGRLGADRKFMGYALAGGLAFGAMFAYIAGSPFVLQGIYRVSPQAFSLIFAVNALGFVITSQVNGSLVGRIEPRVMLRVGLLTSLAGAVLLLIVIVLGGHALWPVLPPLFLLVAAIGFIVPNATALALGRHPEAAGTGSAMLGVVQSGIGSIGAPLVGVAGISTALPMAAVIGTCSVCANVAILLSREVGSERQR